MPMLKNPDPDRAGHGRRYTYQQHGCRCALCTEANTREYREARERKLAGIVREPKKQEKAPLVHGTIRGYRQFRCRCQECVEANAEYTRNYRARKNAGEIEDRPFVWNPVAGLNRAPEREPEGRWADHARCADADVNMFFAERKNWMDTVKAKEICEGCVVKSQCAAWALTATVISAEGDTETFVEGVLGGTTAGERKALRKSLGIGKVGRMGVTTTEENS